MQTPSQDTARKRLTGPPSRWLQAFAGFCAGSVLLLIALGGTVTSKGAGMSVPDWPNTFGYNMFLFPISRWVDGVFWEHSHRLVASGVGLLTVLLAVLLQKYESRAWLRKLGWVCVVAVVLQGVLGGLRVTLIKDELGIFHACLAQAFFCAISFVALSLSHKWYRLGNGADWANRKAPSAVKACTIAVALIFLQLVVGATMRHEHAGLAVPDFPLAYGQVIPPLDGETIAAINAKRVAEGQMPTSALFIGVHMLHRAMAAVIFCAVVLAAVSLHRAEAPGVLRWMSRGWVLMVLCQAGMGAWTVWSNKAADIATGHVVLGSLTLLMGVLIVALGKRSCVSAEQGATECGEHACSCRSKEMPQGIVSAL